MIEPTVSPINEISQLIRIKERELHEIHDIRCSQLEKLVVERDELLVKSSQRFEQLRDDFKYNLALLEARDNEIIRLEKQTDIDTVKISELERDLKASKIALSESTKRETEKEQQHAEDKALNKVTYVVDFRL